MSKEKKSSGVGKVFLGIFLGFILTLGSIVGLGCLVYFKGSLKWLNKIGINVDTGSNKLNEMTLSQIVNSGIKVIGNTNNMSLNDIANEFGYNFKNEIFGIDITDIKTAPVADLKTAIENKFNKISASELEGVVDLTAIEGVLNSKKTFYVFGNNLYSDEAHQNPVDFDYTLNKTENTITIKNQTLTYSNSKVEIEKRYLPLTFVLKEISNSTIAEVLNYKYVDGKYLKDNGNGEEVTGILRLLAPKKVGEIGNFIDSLTLADAFGDDADISTSVISLIPSNTPIKDIPTALQTAIQTKTLDELITSKVIVLDDGVYTQKVKDTIGSKNLTQIFTEYMEQINKLPTT